jgi:predicted peptidase
LDRFVVLIVALMSSGCFGAWRHFPADENHHFFRRASLYRAAPRGYRVYIPDGTGPWPLIVFLHGGGEVGKDEVSPTQVGLGPELYRAGGAFPFVVVFPQSPLGKSWTSPDVEAHVWAVIDDAIAQLPVDAARVYLVGNSMGAHGALLLASHRPERIAAIVAVAGRARPSRWFPTPQDAREDLPRDDPYGALATRLSTVPTWLFHGEEDNITPADESRHIAEALHARRAEVRLTLYKEAGHAGAWERAWASSAVFRWLAQHRR